MSAASPNDVAYRTSAVARAATPELWRMGLSILLPTAWLSFTLLYVGFWAHGFTLFQSIIVILVSLVVLAGTLGALWLSYGVRQHFGRD